MSKNNSLAPAVGAAVLLVIGLALLVPKSHGHRPAAAPSASVPATQPPAPAASPAPAVPPPSPTATAAASESASATPVGAASLVAAMPSGVAAAGDGPGGDADIQAAFTRAHPSDLAPADAAQLAQLGSQVWLAETTGSGRARWPAYFPTQQGAAGAFYYSGVRIQAAVAHTEGGPDKVRVDLLWVGTTPAGDYGDHRPATVHLVRTDITWEPVR